MSADRQHLLPQHSTGGVVDVWHLLVVPADVSDIDVDSSCYTLHHPEGCPVAVTSGSADVEYECPAAQALHEAGTFGLFDRHDEHLEAGLYLVAPWVEVIPSSPDGPEDYDGGWDLVRLAWSEPSS